MILQKIHNTTFLSKLAKLISASEEDIFTHLHEIKVDEIEEQGKFSILLKQRIIASFSLVKMPGCCGAVVSTGANVDKDFRNKGVGLLLNEMRQCIAYRWGYSLMICTDVESNIPQQKILNNAGWIKHISFFNKKTDNQVALHSIVLFDDGGTPLGFDLPLGISS